jgi:hypothetical protein
MMADKKCSPAKQMAKRMVSKANKTGDLPRFRKDVKEGKKK